MPLTETAPLRDSRPSYVALTTLYLTRVTDHPQTCLIKDGHRNQLLPLFSPILFSSSAITGVSIKTMPYCEVRKEQSGDSSDGASLNNGIKIFYRTYGSGPTKVLLIIGMDFKYDSFSFDGIVIENIGLVMK